MTRFARGSHCSFLTLSAKSAYPELCTLSCCTDHKYSVGDPVSSQAQIRCTLRSSQQVATAHPYRPQVPTAFCMDCQAVSCVHVQLQYGPMPILIGRGDTRWGIKCRGIYLYTKVQAVHRHIWEMLYGLHVHSEVCMHDAATRGHWMGW